LSAYKALTLFSLILLQGVNDAPALSAAQVGIAVEGATDAAKNAADLILTKPGLSPIYGAVLESRRIFSRIKSYVIYRVAASIVMVLTLSIVLFASGCAVDSLLIIILALLNDISMIPVAYDNAQATTKPQLPNARKLVIMSLYYGLAQSAAGLVFIFLMNHAEGLEDPIELDSNCSAETRGFIWFHLVLVTELMIFSVRAPIFFLLSRPSIHLNVSVIGTCIGSAFIAVYASELSGFNLLWIILFNLGTLVLADVGKLWFRRLINDEPGDNIESDALLEVPPIETTETEKHMAKKMRYVVHNQSILPPEDRQHVVQIRRKATTGLAGFFTDLRTTTISEGYIDKRIILATGATSMRGVAPPAGKRIGRYKQASMPW
jgi:H+-transporting ATPase